MQRFVWLLLIVLFIIPTRAQQTTIEDLLSEMTLEQKVAQMFMVSLGGVVLTEDERLLLETWQPGAVSLFERNVGNPEETTIVTNLIQQTVLDVGGIPMFIAIDQEGGRIAHLDDGFTQFPVPMLLTASGDTDLAFRVGQAFGDELSAVGIHMNLAPVADLNTNPDNPIIGRRSFGTELELVAPVLTAFVEGMQAEGVMGTAKHFPGHGDTDADSHITLPIVLHDKERLDAVELAPFRATMDADIGAIMTAHIWYPMLEPDSELPASLSFNIITRLLRSEMGYRGIIMTDAMDMDAIDTVYSHESSAILAIKAGNDLVAIGPHVHPLIQIEAIQAVVDAVRDGEIDESQIDKSVFRILLAKAHYGLFDWQPLDPLTAEERVNADEHAELVDEIFRAGITVVFDQENLVPLRGDVALVYPATRFSIRRECELAMPIKYPVGVSDFPDDEEIGWARANAELADVVVVFTSNAETNPRQQALVNALPEDKTVAVAIWSPLDVAVFPQVSSYVATYSPLQPALPAVCRILGGHLPARGRFPLSTSFLDGNRD